jgi:deoxyxylulose-5-phosphate synthase
VNKLFYRIIQFQIVHLLYVRQLLLNIDSPHDLPLDEAQLPQLAQELRNFIIDVVSVKEGILALV